MMKFLPVVLLVSVFSLVADAGAAIRDTRLFELRTYHAAPGKLDELLTRFRDHTCALFEKHGMTNIGYWVPVENDANILVYLLAYPDAEARLAAWQGFGNDPEWRKVFEESRVDGPLVERIDPLFLAATGYSPPVGSSRGDQPRLFEMRTYTARGNLLTDLHERFRDHTIDRFMEHGMLSHFYFQVLPGQPGADQTLVYFLSHDDAESAAESWQAFGADPKWTSAKAASEKAAGGSLTVPGGVKSVFLKPTDFSLTQ